MSLSAILERKAEDSTPILDKMRGLSMTSSEANRSVLIHVGRAARYPGEHGDRLGRVARGGSRETVANGQRTVICRRHLLDTCTMAVGVG